MDIDTRYTTAKDKQGFAILLAMIIISVILSLGLSVLYITMAQLDLGSSTRGSELAYHVTAGAVECIQHLRDTYPDEFLQGSANVPIDCFGWGNSYHFAVDHPDPNHSTYVHFHPPSGISLNWQYTTTPSPENACVGIDVYVLNNSGGTLPMTETIPGDPKTKTCNPGDVCTIGIARGDNVDCSNTSSLNSYQRQLVIDF